MSAWHLVWIVPVCTGLGVVLVHAWFAWVWYFAPPSQLQGGVMRTLWQFVKAIGVIAWSFFTRRGPESGSGGKRP